MIKLFERFATRAGHLALAASLAACSPRAVEPEAPAPPALPPIALRAVGDSVMYLERTASFTLIERPNDTLRINGNHDAVIHVMRTAPDTLEALYEHLLLNFRTRTQNRNIDTDALIGERFRLHEERGRIALVSAPQLPAEIRQLTDLRRQFDDFFMRVPRQPMTVGMVWVDTVHHQGQEGDASMDRNVVTRFTVRRDTVMHAIDALVVDYVSVLENSMRSAPTTEGTLVSRLLGEEEGTFVYAPAAEVMLRRKRVGLLEGELVIEGNLETHRFPQSYGYESVIELIPPALPGSANRPAPAPAEPRPEL